MSTPVNRFNVGTGVINDIPIYTEFEYTSKEVQDQYVAYLQVLQDVYKMTTVQFAAADKAALALSIKNALAGLIDLAQNGINSVTVPASGSQPAISKQFYLTSSMATQLDTLTRTFRAVGTTNPEVAISVAQLEKWKDLSIISPSIGNALESALGVSHDRTLQAMVEVDYVTTGNDLINAKLSNLEEKLRVTQGIISSLTSLQLARNNMATANPKEGDQKVSEMPVPTTDLINYNAVSGAFQSGLPTRSALPLSLNSGGVTLFNQLIALKASLQAYRTQLSTLLPSGVSDDNSMYGQIGKVLTDFNQLFVYPTPPPPAATTSFIIVSAGSSSLQKAQALYTFLVDRNNPTLSQFTPGPTTADGQSQTHLTAAITSCQATNDQQKEDVRNALFVFEEFYKSASAILQKITQIVEKMAQNISR